MTYELSATQLKNVLDALNGVDGTRLDPDAAKALLNVSSAVSRYLVQQNESLKSKNATLGRQVERMRNRFQEQERILVEQDAFDCTGLDSVEVGKAILYQLQKTRTYLSRDKFTFIVYLFYCSWLYHNKKRLFIELPKAIDKGPRFWKMQKEIPSVVTPVEASVWAKFAVANTAIAGHIESFVTAYVDYSEEDLKKFIIRSEPFRIAMETAAKNGKKSWSISDKDIFYWKEEQKAK